MKTADRSDRKTPSIPEIDVLWVTGGLSCDDDTIAMTAAFAGATMKRRSSLRSMARRSVSSNSDAGGR